MKQFRFKKAVSFLLAIAMAFTTLTVISTTEAQAATKAIQIKNVTGTTKSLNVGKTFTIKTNYTASKLTFKSSKPAIASVTSKGKIAAKKAGTAKITITLKANKKVKKALTVKVLKTLEVTNVSDFNKTLQVGKSFTIKSNYKASDLEFKPSDTSIINVDTNGKVTALGVGEASVLITNKKDSSQSVTIRINAVKLTKIVDGRMEESFNPAEGKSNYRIYIDTMRSVGAKGYRTHAAFTIKDLPSDLKSTPNGGKLWNESRCDYVAIWAIDPIVDHYSHINEITDDVCDKWSKSGKAANITRTETNTYYKLYFTYDDISQYGQYSVLDVVLQDKETKEMTEIIFSFNKQNQNQLSMSEILAIGESMTLENFTVDDLGK